MKTLIKRELSSLLCSPVALSFLSFFLLAAGLMNWYFQGSYNIMDNGYAGLDKFFRLAAQLFMVTIPALTMRAFAEEKRNKNLDMFRTRPVSIASLYVGKLIAAWAIILLALTATLVYVFSVSALSVPSGNIDMHEIVASYFALSLLGVAFVCLGLFASSLTNNQITSFLLAVLLNFTAFYGFDLIAALFDGGTWQLTISSFGISAHNELMRKGVIRGGDLLTLFNYMAVFSTLAVFVTSLKNRRTYKKLLLALSVIIIVNGICRFIPDFRMDFTTDKRYTISDYSKKLLKQSAEEKTPVRFNVYLDGDMNAAFRHLQDAVKDILADFKAYSHGNITFEFLNPYILGGSRDEVFAKMAGQNMNGIALNETDREGKTSQKIIYPYAQAICGTDTLAINLLKNIAGYTAEENINASIENIEFELIDAIRLLEKKEPEAIAFIEGHGELPRPYVYDAEELLSKYFNVNRGEIGYNTSDLDEFKAVIIAGTTARFNEREKYILDHYLMSGGRILWLLDGVFLSRDELRRNAQTPAIKNETNLDDLLFTYGVRINPALVQDVQCAPVLLASDNGQYTTVPNYYSILLLPSNNQPVTKDISPVKAEFASPIDILAHSSDVEINVLLSSSMQSHVVPVPEQITLLSPEISISSDYFDKSFLPTAVALHGKFQSAFKNRLIPDSIITDGKTPLFQSQPTKIVVVSSSDIIRNEVIGAGTQSHILPMGYDRISDRQYGNRQFIANVVNWLVNDDEWLSLRAKQQHIRLLNRQLIYSDRQRYAWINILVPLVFVCVIVGGYHFYRKRKYEKN